MAKPYLSMILLCLTTYCTARVKTELEKQNIWGKVASVSSLDSCYDKPNTGCKLQAGADYNYTTHMLDERGNQVSCSYYDKTGQLLRQVTNHYDANNNKTETVCRQPNGDLLYRYVYSYDAKGYPLETYYYNKKDSLISKMDLGMRYQTRHQMQCYDREGKMTGSGYYDKDGNVTLKDADPPINIYARTYKITEHDSNGRETKITTFGLDSTLKGYTTFIYDANGNQVEEYRHNESGVQTMAILKAYDSQGNMLLSTINKSDGSHGRKEEYTYDGKGNKVEAHTYNWKDGGYVLLSQTFYNQNGLDSEMTGYNSNGAFEGRYNSTYDARGNKLYHATYDKDGSITKENFYRYEDFDSHGNWHKMIDWGNENNIKSIGYRDIKYYE